jgi:RNA polymerase sigma-70 factor (ECF subfamily)
MAESDDLEQIVAGCKNGDSGSFSRLVDLFGGRCYGYFYRMTGNKEISEDLLSELFVRLVQKIGSFKGDSFEGWLFKVASNIFHDHLRGKQREKKLLAFRMEQLEWQPKNITPDIERVDDLQVQLSKLDVDTRELIMLRFYSQASFKEIAAMRAEPIGTTLSKLHRGLKKLRELMEPEQI